MCLIVSTGPRAEAHSLTGGGTDTFYAGAGLRAHGDPRQSCSPSAQALSGPTVAAGRYVKGVSLAEHVCSVLFPARGHGLLGTEHQDLHAKSFRMCV